MQATIRSSLWQLAEGLENTSGQRAAGRPPRPEARFDESVGNSAIDAKVIRGSQTRCDRSARRCQEKLRRDGSRARHRLVRRAATTFWSSAPSRYDRGRRRAAGGKVAKLTPSRPSVQSSLRASRPGVSERGAIACSAQRHRAQNCAGARFALATTASSASSTLVENVMRTGDAHARTRHILRTRPILS